MTPGRSSSDIQRCTDVALENAKIQFRFDNLEARRRLGGRSESGRCGRSDSGGPAESSYISGCTAAMQALSRVLKFEYSSSSSRCKPTA